MSGIIFFLLTLMVHCFGQANSLSVTGLRTNSLQNPMGVSTTTPRFSWWSTSTKRADAQTAYQIQIATSSNALSSPDLWDTGKVSSSDIYAVYGGSSLSSRKIGFWRIRAWDSSDTVSSWSSIATFEMGLLSSSDWAASWIANKHYVSGTNSLPIFAKTFTVQSTCVTTKARLYLLGLGQHSAMINGFAVTDAVLEPGYATYTKTLRYSSYNISTLLTPGNNVIGIELGKGVYDTEPGVGGRYMKFTNPAQQLKLIAQLEYSCLDGSKVTIPSDTTWVTTTSGPLLESSWYGGEEYDARNISADYSKPSGNRKGWVNSNTTTSPGGVLVGDANPPIKIITTFTAPSVTKVGSSWVFDMGTNFAGWFSLSMTGTGKAGTRIIFYPSEILSSSGLANQASTGHPIFDAYTLSGSSSETYTPKFMYHAFRYVQVNGITWTPKASDMKGHIIRATLDSVGSVSTSNAQFNSIHKIMDRALQSNLHSVMTDCPHREKLGWIDEYHLLIDPISRLYDFEAYGRQFMKNFMDTQASSGYVPTIAPQLTVFTGEFYDDPNWGSAIVWLPFYLYRHYGDTNILSEYYLHMQSYVNFLTNTKASGYLLQYGVGDWASTDKSSTPVGVAATFAYAQAVKVMGIVATALGKTSDASTYSVLESNILSAFHSKYFNKTTQAGYCSGSQTCNAMALDMGAVPTSYHSVVMNSLANSIVKNGYHLTVGEIANPSLWRSLQSGGRNDVLYNVMSIKTSPSYGFMLAGGATSLWEYLNGVGGAYNHFMYGYPDSWFTALSGLAQSNTSVGWQEIDYRPLTLAGLTSASHSYRTIRGTASAEWSLSGGTLTYNLVVPVGSIGTVYLNQSTITESGNALSAGSNGIISSKSSGGTLVIKVSSGTYSFKSVA